MSDIEYGNEVLAPIFTEAMLVIGALGIGLIFDSLKSLIA